jgi:2-C-methyl-D-erythritol 4-phosphate cytidylyltransferase / 2-C-methyl-D-erythritol 2,4-cyclodiphosphate synthase
MKISAILLAAGSGKRLKKSVPKAFVQISGKEILLASLELLESAREISETILVVPKSEIAMTKKLTADFTKISKIVAGGSTRQKSLAAGLRFAREKFVLSHNAANPFVTRNEIFRLTKTLQKYDAVGVAHRADSTVRLEMKTLPRQKIWLMETPQLIKKDFLECGLKIANSQKIETTDEIQLAELAGAKIKIIAADSQNRKITRSEDLPTENRVGLGHDSHKFSKKKKSLILGGVRISPTDGLQANSDGDVVLHALTNAISAALGGGSLSTFADKMCRQGIKDSRKYLAVVLKKMKLKNFKIENLAISIEGKKPKLEKHFSKIKKSLAKLLLLEGSRIGLVATTGEGLTSFGRGGGLQVFAVILLKK